MDELTLTPVSKKEETPQENKESKSTSDYLEMDSISLNTNSSKDATEAAFEELDAKDIKSLMEQEKLERQKAKEQDIGTKKDVNLDKPDVKPKRKSHDVSL